MIAQTLLVLAKNYFLDFHQHNHYIVRYHQNRQFTNEFLSHQNQTGKFSNYWLFTVAPSLKFKFSSLYLKGPYLGKPGTEKKPIVPNFKADKEITKGTTRFIFEYHHFTYICCLHMWHYDSYVLQTLSFVMLPADKVMPSIQSIIIISV